MTTEAEHLANRRDYRGVPWPPGPWDDEPDRVEWRHDPSNLPCLIRRGPTGALCGYVGVPPGHPYHGRGYSECLVNCGEDCCYEHSLDTRLDVHGGVNYSRACDGDEEDGICHIPQPGESGDVWWLGFDCGHAFDVTPSMLNLYREIAGNRNRPDISPSPFDETYKNVDYVRGEVNKLADQLAAVT